MHEFVACGIREKAFDEGTYKRVRFSTVLKDWAALQGFVTEFRRKEGRVTIFQEFEWLNQRWVENPLTPDKKSTTP